MKKNYQTHNCNSNQKKFFRVGQRHQFLKIIGFLLFISSGTIFGQESKLKDSKSPWEEKTLQGEILSKRSRTAKHFMVDGTKISAFISPSSIHYMDGGKWENINTDIIGNNSTTHPYASKRNAIKTYFPSNPFSDYIIMESKEETFKEKVLAIKFLDAVNNVVGTLPISGNISSTVNGNKISYTGFYPNVSLFYSMGNDQRKFNLVIESSAFYNAIPVGATSLVIEEEFISENGVATITSSDAEVVVTAKGTQVLSFSKPVGFDSNAAVEDMAEGTLSVQTNNQSFIVSTTFSLGWIKNNNRVFPILLDPTVNYYPQGVNFWTGYQTSSTAKANGYLRLTLATTAAWAKFDLSTLPVGAAYTQATYYGYHYTTLGIKDAEIRGMQTVDPVPAAAATIFSQVYSGPLYNSSYSFGTNTFGWNAGILNSTALTDIGAAAGNWIALGFGYLSGSTSFMYQYGWNAASSSDIPYLEVVYFTTPCSGTPTSNTITPATFSTCPGFVNPNLGFASTYTVGGLNYQWQISSASAVGPWTVIPSSTLSAVQIPTLSTTSWIQAVVTCTNPGGGTYSVSASQVYVAGTTTNTVPYYENFEGIQAENRFPNCSWYSSDLGTTVNTYTAAASDNRVPLSGNNFATFGLPSNNSHVFTNGILMTAGITYSAALWYATEYLGYSNWTDLTILVGNSQTTTGLIPIDSIGPVISGSHKLLSGVFTVPSTGLYYIAIRANSTSGSALYISWDDLSVTIPCQGDGAVNSPTVMVSANTPSVCSGQDLILTASGADTYTWSNGQMSSILTESPTLLGLNSYMVMGTNLLTGCTSTASQNVFVKQSPIILTTAYPATVCVGEPVTLSALGNAASYLWSNGGNIASITLTVSGASTFSVIGTSTNGCAVTAVQSVNVFNLPVITASSSKIDACKDDVITLTGNGASTYAWISDTSPNILQGATVNVSLNAQTVFTVTGTDAVTGCTAETTLVQSVTECLGVNKFSNGLNQVKIYPNPVNDKFVVEMGDVALKTIELVDATGRLIFTTKSSDFKTELNIKNLSAGIYYLKVTSNNATEVVKVIKK